MKSEQFRILKAPFLWFQKMFIQIAMNLPKISCLSRRIRGGEKSKEKGIGT